MATEIPAGTGQKADWTGKIKEKAAIGQFVENRYNLFTTKSFKQFRQGFQQESILLHRGNVENCVESVENPVESRGNNEIILVMRCFCFVENSEKPAGKPQKRRGKVHLPCGKRGSDFNRKKVYFSLFHDAAKNTSFQHGWGKLC